MKKKKSNTISLLAKLREDAITFGQKLMACDCSNNSTVYYDIINRYELELSRAKGIARVNAVAVDNSGD